MSIAIDARPIAITLPDGTVRDFTTPPTGAEVAASISKGLAKQAYLVEVDGEPRDLSRPIEADARVRVLKVEDPTALAHLRHDCAHVMAEAVQELFPGTQVTIGPAIENGFYYDFARAEPFTPDDLARIEARMGEIVEGRPAVRARGRDRDDARRALRATWASSSRLELIDAIPEGEAITLYHQGDWLDLCRGPHVPVDRQDRRPSS